MWKLSIARSVLLLSTFVTANPVLAQQQVADLVSLESGLRASGSSAYASEASPTPTSSAASTSMQSADQHKLGSFNVFVNWRFRTETWDWFQPTSTLGQNTYAFEHSLLRVGIGQTREDFEWQLEGAQDAIVALPTHAVLPGVQGQLGLGGTYYAANGNGQTNANGFVRQAYAGFRLPGSGKARLGRMTFLDGTEVTPKDTTLATLVNTRITQRLIGDFGFSAVGRSYDGILLSYNEGGGNFTVFGARPTRGVYQIDGMGELDVDLFYGAYTLPVASRDSSGELRIFAVGYVDERGNVLKTDNRSVVVRAADNFHIRIGTYGADYVDVLRTENSGTFDFLAWGVLQSGSWGTQAQRAGAFVGEFGWQPPVQMLKPWFSAGYSFGSGDSNPADHTHSTFFQILPTPRPYARFPFYNMMNNEDFYGTAVVHLPHSIVVRSEVHALRLASAEDLWYSGGGAFQPKTFGYSGRASGGSRSLANVWDVSMDVPLRFGFSLTTYYAHAWGKSVVASIYPEGTNAQFGYVETDFHF